MMHMKAKPSDYPKSTRRFKQRIAAVSALVRDKRGVAYLEFALVLPVFLTMGLYGTEIAYMATINMQVSQIATAVADNASRIGQTDNSGLTPTVSEGDVESVLGGALLQGQGIDFETNGRIILSSLESDSITGKQYIHWQRCVGNADVSSSYGPEGFGLDSGNLAGMGKAGNLITASNGSSVMYAEVFYTYTPLFGDMFVDNVQFKQEMAFETRDDRNLVPGITGGPGATAC